MRRFPHKIVLSLCIACALIGATLPTSPAYAQIPVTDAVMAGLFSGRWTKDEFWAQAWEGLKASAKVAVANAARYFMQKLAYDSAVYLTSGGSGEKPLLATKGFGEYVEDTGKEAVGSALDGLSETWGVDLCTPSSGGPLLQAVIQTGLSEDFGLSGAKPKPPACTLQKLTDNFDGYLAQFDSPEKALDQVGLVFKPEGNDLGVAFKAHQTVLKQKTAKELEAAEERKEGQGFLSQKSKTGKFVTTPGSFVAQEAFGRTSDKERQLTQAEFQAMSTTESLQYILINSAITFTNTLAQRGLQRLSEEGFISVADIFGLKDHQQALFSETASVGYGGVASAKLAYADLLTPQITTGDSYSAVNELLCPAKNCAMDQSFMQAINASNQGTPTTITMALAKGWLHGDWKLYPPEHELNSNKNCPTSGYCYSNLVKLRRARIIPIGFELAAHASPKDNPWSLQQVVAGFANCAGGVWDENHPFCHLIDPNWVIKAPSTRCGAKGFGQTLLSPNSNLREETCVDVQDCVATDEQGNCIGAWGYCMQEKNTWKLNADTCPAVYAGCSVYNSRKGGQFGYIGTTINYDICNATNVGCRGYYVAPKYNSAGVLGWNVGNGDALFATGDIATGAELLAAQTASNVTGAKIFFNKDVVQCNEADAGCTRVIRADGTELHVKLAPDTFMCYDTDTAKKGIQLPYSVEDAKTLAAKSGCDKYAGVCGQEELGCQAYTRAQGGSEVTGIVQASDYCAQECVGYNGYKQDATEFEDEKFPVYTIPSLASQCSFDAAGCDEFTNLDKASAGGEGTEYYQRVRYCEKPGTAAPPNFYTWEGSDTVGFALRVHHLKVGADSDPAYVTSDAGMLAQFVAECNKEKYNANQASLDCREIYNEKGDVFYRLLTKTVTISQDCHPLRRSGVSNKSECESHGGTWQETGSFCLYFAIPSESQSCSSQAAGCRVYQGAGDAELAVVDHNFETTANLVTDLGYLAPALISSESLVAGGHSLSLPANITGQNFKIDMRPGSTYFIRFWAKGSGQVKAGVKLGAGAHDYSFTDAQGTDDSSKKLTSSWRYFSFGPIRIPDNAVFDASQKLFYLGSTGADSPIFFDNLQIVKGDFVTFIKNSAQVPTACDPNSSDNVPGPALGCALYKEGTGGKEVALKSFSNLCRPEAIGCENIIDTRNTKETDNVRYNTNTDDAKGIKNGDPNDDIVIPADRGVRVIINTQSVCSAAAAGCQMAGVEQIVDKGGVKQKQIVPAHIINNPSRYDTMLCQAKAEGCDAFTSTQGVSYFKDPQVTTKLCDYRSNEILGGQQVSGWFKTGAVDLSGAPIAEPCTSGYVKTGNEYGIAKNSDVTFEGYTGTCNAEFDQCFELVDPLDFDSKGIPKSYFVVDNSNLDKSSCKGQVSRYDGCVLFDDTRNLKKEYSARAAYEASESHAGKLVAASQYSVRDAFAGVSVPVLGYEQTCNGYLIEAIHNYTGSSESGSAVCAAIVNENAKPNTNLDFFGSTCSGAANGSFAPVSDQNIAGSGLGVAQLWKLYAAACQQKVGASNLVLRVRRDRECAQWLSCNSYTKVPNAPADRQLQCSGLGVCEKYKISKDGSVSQCAKWVSFEDSVLYGKVLDAAAYGSRGVRFNDVDFSGFSSGLRFHPGNFEVVSYDYVADNQTVTAHRLGATLADSYLKTQGVGALCQGKPDGTGCGSNSAVGTCIKGTCTYTIAGTKMQLAAVPKGSTGTTACRAFPEESSPFAGSVVSAWSAGGKGVDPVSFERQEYAKANICWDGSECACSYQKVSFTGKAVYTDIGAPFLPKGICLGGFYEDGGSKTGLPCGDVAQGGGTEYCQDERGGVQTPLDRAQLLDANLSQAERETIVSKPPAQDGICQIRDPQMQQFRGWQGYCVEEDLRTPVVDALSPFACGSWYPIDVGAGLFDLYNQFNESGYRPTSESGTLWCVQSSGNMSTAKNDSFDFAGAGQLPTEKNAYTYKAASMTANVAIVGNGNYCSNMPSKSCLTDSDCGTVGGVGGLFNSCQKSQKFASLSVQTWPKFSNFTDIRGAKGAIAAADLDGIVLKLNKYAGNEIIIGGDGMTRCYGAPDPNGGENGDLKSLCSLYTSRTQGGVPITQDGVGGEMGITRSKIKYTQGGVAMEDWIFLWLSTRAFDHGDCNQNFQSTPVALQDAGNGSLFKTLYAKGDGDPFTGPPDPQNAGLSDYGFFNYNDVGALSSFCDTLGKDTGHENCPGDTEYRNFGAMRFQFKNGSLHEVRSLLCNGNDTNSELSGSVTFLFREQCQYIAQAVNDDTEQSNVAYTQRVWAKQGDVSLGDVSLYDREGVGPAKAIPNKGRYHFSNNELLAPGTYFMVDEQMSPYGSIHTGVIPPKLPVYTFAQTKLSKDDGRVAVPDTRPDLLQSDAGIITRAASLGCPGQACGEYQYNADLRNGVSTDVSSVVHATLNDIFAKIYQVFKAKPSGDGYEKTKESAVSPLSKFDKRVDHGRPPAVAAVDEKTPTSGAGLKLTKINAFNVNGRSEGIVFGFSGANATARFSAWADTDQMPLKRVLVDWSDDAMSGGATGKYKNKKPYCSQKDAPIGYCVASDGKLQSTPNMTCKADDDCKETGAYCFGNDAGEEKVLVFGNDPAACTEGVFEYAHVYTYDPHCGMPSEEDVSKNPSDAKYPKHVTMTKELLDGQYKALKTFGVLPQDNVCIYKPKVQVQDNWGWCNGTCRTGENGAKGCVDTGGVVGFECDPNDPTGKGWTAFGGEVVIVDSD